MAGPWTSDEWYMYPHIEMLVPTDTDTNTGTYSHTEMVVGGGCYAAHSAPA